MGNQNDTDRHMYDYLNMLAFKPQHELFSCVRYIIICFYLLVEYNEVSHDLL